MQEKIKNTSLFTENSVRFGQTSHRRTRNITLFVNRDISFFKINTCKHIACSNLNKI